MATQMPGSTPKSSTAAVVDSASDELAAPEGAEAAQLGDVDESQSRIDDDGAEGCEREEGEERPEPQQRRDDEDERDEGVQLRPAPSVSAMTVRLPLS